MNGTDDTEYEDEDQDPDAYREDETPEPEYEDGEEEPEANQAMQVDLGNREPVLVPNSTDVTMADATSRLNAQLMVSQPNDAWRPPPPATYRSFADMLPIVESPRSPPASDAASNRSGGTNRSNGAAFFRHYLDGGLPARTNGALTPDLNFAEIGHGRGAQASGSAMQYHMRRGQEHLPHPRPPFSTHDSYGDATNSSSRLPMVDAWPYQEPPSPAIASTSMTQDTSTGTVQDARGRGVKKSIINAAEHLFGRASGSRNSNDEGSPRPSGAGTSRGV